MLGLRARLWWRRLRTRGALGRGLAVIAVPGGLAGLIVFASFINNAVEGTDPTLVAAGMAAVLVAAHGIVFFEVTAQVGAGEGMAAALYHYPLSPGLIHASETLVGGLSPSVLMASTVLFVLGGHAAAIPVLGLLWALVGVAYLVAFRQLFKLLLARLLRRRLLREIAMALLSFGVLGSWLAMNWAMEKVDPAALMAWLEAAPGAFWALPVNWFSAPVVASDVPGWARMAAGLGAPTLVAAAYIVGAVLQDQSCYGEADAPWGLGGRRRTRRARWHLADRFPLALVPPAVWATAARELKTLRRDPFLVVMLLSQGVLLLAPPLLFPALKGGGAGWLPALAMLLLLTESGPLSNLVATEGRGLLYLAQTPTSRAEVLVGKNLGYFGLFGLFNIAFMSLGALVFERPGDLVLLLPLVELGLLVVMGVGNVVSVLLPMARMGARAQQGGQRGAVAAAEGGVEPPGCGTMLGRFFLSQFSLLLLSPAVALVLLGSRLADGAALIPALLAASAWCGLVYLAGTALAVGRWRSAEEQLVARFATRGAQ